MSDVNDICDEVAAIIEPDPGLRDDGRMRPFGEPDVDRLYLWPRREEFPPAGTRGETSGEFMERFTLGALWVIDKRGEVDRIDRTLSDEVVARVESMARELRAHPTGKTYRDIVLEEVDYEREGYENRGFTARITGWVIRS